MRFSRRESGGGVILHDRELGIDPALLFDRDALQADGAIHEVRGGRGSISFLELQGRQFALRRYRRGGLPARLSRDRYLWLGEDRTRAFRELRLLGRLADLGLPVPTPAAARYERTGFTYRGELVTARIPGARSLATRWLDGTAGDAAWVAAGRCIRRFHDAGVDHADLNAHNVMLDEEGRAWLLDFDRGRLRSPGSWQERRLARLARSLRKVARAAGREAEWSARYAALRAAHDGG